MIYGFKDLFVLDYNHIPNFLLFALLIVVIVYLIRQHIKKKKIKTAQIKAEDIISDAIRKADELKKEALFEAKEEIHALRTSLDKETRERRSELQRFERRNQKKEESLEARQKEIDKKTSEANNLKKQLEVQKEKLDEYEGKKLQELERISFLSKDEAKQELLQIVDKDLAREKVIRIREMEEEIDENAKKYAQKILANTINSIASEFVADNTVSVVELPNDDMKGRIIGREGRNIRAFEHVSGVDLIIDDTPEAVIISCFDSVRREIARVALEKLISDGRIHPSHIEEMYAKAKDEVEQKIKEEGKNALFELEISRVHPELVKLLGRLQFRTSYGQNMLKHSIEVSKIAGMLAEELGINSKLAKRAALFHDIGKAVDQTVEGTHVELGMALLKKYGEHADVIHAMSTHHGDYEPRTIEAIIVTAADAISAARPGARRESLDNYIKRLQGLENIANSYEGVEKSFAIQAGRELRIIVYPDKISDDEMVLLSRQISKQIQDELEYPGQVKVNLIRESRAISYAK